MKAIIINGMNKDGKTTDGLADLAFNLGIDNVDEMQQTDEGVESTVTAWIENSKPILNIDHLLEELNKVGMAETAGTW